MAEEARGMFRVSLRVKCVRVSTSVGSTEDLPGSSSTSSKVRPSGIEPSIIPASPRKNGRLKFRAIKQRSPAGTRWAGSRIHQIEKMRHGELTIVGAGALPVKLEASEGEEAGKIIGVRPHKRPHPRRRNRIRTGTRHQ